MVRRFVFLRLLEEEANKKIGPWLHLACMTKKRKFSENGDHHEKQKLLAHNNLLLDCMAVCILLCSDTLLAFPLHLVIDM